LKPDVPTELDIIRQGVVEIIQEKELFERLTKSRETKVPLKVKLGCDPSRPDIHLGHVVQLNKLKQFQTLGHHIVFIIGDFTGLIGDPSGKDATRPMLTREEVEANAKTYFSQVGKILDLDKVEIAFNSAWLSPLNFESVIRLASHYTVARMLERDDFEKRYQAEKPISVQEFLYPLAQAYDSVVIKADVELGGTDQKFNFLLTRDIQKAYGQAPEVVITNPLLVGLDGVQKMSKSLDNYIAINDSAGEIFGKIMSISDELMWNYFTLLTSKTPSEIVDLKQKCVSGEVHPMEAKKDLGQRVAEMFHSRSEALQAREEFNRVFSEKLNPTEPILFSLSTDLLNENKIWLVKLLVLLGFAKTNGEARRLIMQGAVSIDGQRLNDPNCEINPSTGMIIKSGKKNFAKLLLTARL
jgi:tyrosyl-tRNA synthetase